MVSVIFISAFAPSAGAIPSLTWTDSNITYSLEITGDDTAEFTIAVDSAVSDWRVGWVAFMFSSGGGEINGISGPSGNGWEVGYDGVGLPWGGSGNEQDINPFKGKWTGFYSEDILTDVAGGGLPLDADTYTWSINTEGGIDFFEDEMPFKVGFYDLETGNPHGRIKIDQLSEHLSVPEPATLFLLGSGLALLWLFGRRRFRAVR